MSSFLIALSKDEAAKLHALGGAPWVRLQLQRAEMPTEGLRGLYGLTDAERQQLLADLPVLGRRGAARKYRVQPFTIDQLRRAHERAVGAETPQQRREARNRRILADTRDAATVARENGITKNYVYQIRAAARRETA